MSSSASVVEVVEPKPDMVTGQILPGVDLEVLMEQFGQGQRTPQYRKVVFSFIGPARGNLKKACEMAGYKWPGLAANQLMKRFGGVWEVLGEALENQRVMSVSEWDMRVTWLARNPNHKDHYKGLELWGKVIGRVTDKLSITIDRPQLNVQLQDLVASLLSAKSKQLNPNNPIDITPEPQQLAAGPSEPTTASD